MSRSLVHTRRLGLHEEMAISTGTMLKEVRGRTVGYGRPGRLVKGATLVQRPREEADTSVGLEVVVELHTPVCWRRDRCKQ